MRRLSTVGGRVDPKAVGISPDGRESQSPATHQSLSEILSRRFKEMALKKDVERKSPIEVAAANLKHHRQMKNITIRQAADLCGIAPGTYQALERGNPGSGINHMLQALQTLGVDLQKAFVELHLPHGGVETKVIEGRVQRRFPEMNSVKIKARGMQF